MSTKEQIERDFFMLLEDIDSGDECLLSNYHMEVVAKLLADNAEKVKKIFDTE
jgi:hypothetical protein